MFKTVDFFELYTYDVTFVDLPNYISMILVNNTVQNYSYTYNSTSNQTFQEIFVLLGD